MVIGKSILKPNDPENFTSANSLSLGTQQHFGYEEEMEDGRKNKFISVGVCAMSTKVITGLV